MVEIDCQSLSPEAVENLITEVVLREGTDYGETEILFEDKKQQLRKLLSTKQAVIVYDERDDFCDIVPNQNTF